MTVKRKAYAAWVAVCLLWGTTYLAMRIALETIPPFVMAGLRWVVAGALLIAALRARGEPIPPVRAWGSLAILGILLLACGNGGVAWAEQYVPSGLTAVLVSMSPFWMVGVDAVMPGDERLTARRFVGLVIGFGGIALLVWPEIRFGSGAGFVAGVVAAQIACAGWAIGSGYARRRGKDENVLMVAAFEMLFGGLFLLVVASLGHEWAAVSYNPRTLGALAYLTFFGAIGGFSAYAYALKHLPVATVSLYAYVNPVIAVVLGTLVLHEPFTSRTAVAAGVVLGGMALVKQRQ